MLMDNDKYTLIGIKQEMQKLFDKIEEVAKNADSEVRVEVTHMAKGKHYIGMQTIDNL